MIEESISARRDVLESVRANPKVPVLIVGGGIIGAGLFRELALQGVDALLVDRSDFSVGASAGPSRMIHGGFRYLEFGEDELVMESVRERNILLKTAPHYVFPLPTTRPVLSRYMGMGYLFLKKLGFNPKRPPYRGSCFIKHYLKTYEQFGDAYRTMPRYTTESKKEAFKRRPGLRKDVTGTITYYDAWITYPERLCMELLFDGEELSSGAKALNYVSLKSASGSTVILTDELTGEDIEVSPGVVVNATGAWIDKANKSLGLETEMINGTKGGHLILENEELVKAFDDEQLFYETPDGRVSITLTWHGKAMIGSTDIKISDPDDVRCEEDEIDYIINAINVVLPDIKVDRSQILSSFSGVRPLRKSDASQTVQMSRAHSCSIIEPSDDLDIPVYCMVGGKWTPFRSFAEQTADKLLEFLGKNRMAGSIEVAIGGGKDYPVGDEAKKQWADDQSRRTGLSQERMGVLLYRYGTVGAEVADFLTAGEDAPLKNHEGYTRREIEYMVRSERVFHLDDLLLRRTTIALLGELTSPLLDELASIMASILGWSDEQARDDKTRVLKILKDKFGISEVK